MLYENHHLNSSALVRSLPPLAVAGLLALATACTGGPAPAGAPRSLGPALPAGSTALGPPSAAPASAAAAPVQAPIADLVGGAIPRLRGVPPGQQLRTLKWMLAVPDDRRLVVLFEDLRDETEQPLDDRAATARQRIEDFVQRLQNAGHQAPDPDSDIARIDDDAPVPASGPPVRADQAPSAPPQPPRRVRPPAGSGG